MVVGGGRRVLFVLKVELLGEVHWILRELKVFFCLLLAESSLLYPDLVGVIIVLLECGEVAHGLCEDLLTGPPIVELVQAREVVGVARRRRIQTRGLVARLKKLCIVILG